MNNVYLHRLCNVQYHINEQLKEAKETLCNMLVEKGNLSEIDNVKDSQKYTATYIDNDGNPQSAYYSALELQDGRLYIGLSDEHWLYEEDIKAEHILDLITVIEEGHGKHTK